MLRFFSLLLLFCFVAAAPKETAVDKKIGSIVNGTNEARISGGTIVTDENMFPWVCYLNEVNKPRSDLGMGSILMKDWVLSVAEKFVTNGVGLTEASVYYNVLGGSKVFDDTAPKVKSSKIIYECTDNVNCLVLLKVCPPFSIGRKILLGPVPTMEYVKLKVVAYNTGSPSVELNYADILYNDDIACANKNLDGWDAAKHICVGEETVGNVNFEGDWPGTPVVYNDKLIGVFGGKPGYIDMGNKYTYVIDLTQKKTWIESQTGTLPTQ